MSFVAIDFETASRSPDSACALGMVRFNETSFEDEFYTLIAPPDMYFEPFNISIHGIHPEDVKDAPDFAHLYESVIEFIGDSVVMAHNAGFDLGVLRALMQRYNLRFPEYRYYCTWQLSRRLYPELPSRSLDALARRINFRFSHHNALEDAKACAAVFQTMVSEVAPMDIASVMGCRKFICTPEI